MVIVGVLLIVAVLLDAWRRIRRDRHTRVKMKLVDPADLPPEVPDDIGKFGELPNGGARVVERGDILRAAGYPPGSRKAAAAEAAVDRASTTAADDDGEALVAGIAPDTRDDDETQNLDWLDGLVADSDNDRDRLETEAPPPGKLPRGVEPEVFMLNVVARSPEGLRGDDILQILLACDLRFGDMDFFHRHEFEAGRGAIQFSVADMMQPGVFDIDTMSDMTTPGLVFFLTLPGPENMMQAYDYMLETAQTVARNLGADVLDESRSVLTPQTKEHSRQQIRELERRMLAKAR
ncbi:MAG: cell division protein ZipA [Halioglobus sp.]|jgi:cell division protein ZipA|nr:cell division protein ZipA [Halioglobus sp.]